MEKRTVAGRPSERCQMTRRPADLKTGNRGCLPEHHEQGQYFEKRDPSKVGHWPSKYK